LIWQAAFAFAAICKRNCTKKLISCRDIAFSSVLNPPSAGRPSPSPNHLALL
jgi:hypothetical protein